ncbi:hypothetical protein [Deinococcus sp. 23YEL01]|uniref:hypothetical protein n=1 Tax=Deinococcus sp. 23YEL01 TaxID=2745871 RepID=UPI001E41ECAF|nr:hypothetical protein [Deinococcus sp. 23YEL01]MCD0170791.1 hypothetical protein [Deinococcus sp. 23YEL01]
MPSTTMSVNRLELLKFMNSGDLDANGHHTGMTGLIGEPLAVGLILDCLRQEHPNAACVSMKVTTGAKKGPRLDAWIYDGQGTLYQTEIKMWGGNAIGGVYLAPDTSKEKLREIGQRQWHRWIWDKEKQVFQEALVQKVLRPMQRPAGYESDAYRVEPLLCLWWLVHPDNTDTNWTTVPLTPAPEFPFPQVHIFSLTRYLMGLKEEILHLELPLLGQRFAWLDRIFPAPPGP